MRFARDTLIQKALEVVDEAVRACHHAPIEPSLGLRFALTFLYACSDGRDRRCYEDFLTEVQSTSPTRPPYMDRYSRATHATTYRTGIARSVGAEP